MIKERIALHYETAKLFNEDVEIIPYDRFWELPIRQLELHRLSDQIESPFLRQMFAPKTEKELKLSH